VVLVLLSGLAMVFAPWVVRHVLAPGFAGSPEKMALTVDLMRLMLPSTIIFGLSGLAMGVLNSNQVFFAPAVAPAMYQVGLIFGITILAPRIGVYGLAWGVLAGAGMHLVVQLPALLRLKGTYHFGLDWISPDVREVVRLMAPRLLGVAVVQLNFWINTRLASQFVEGSVTGIVLAFSLMLMPQAAIAQSIAIAAMPTFSAQVALGKLAEMRASLAASLRGALLLSVPASVGLMLLREPVVALLYQRGEFDEFSTRLVSWALLWYAAGMVGHSLVEILSRAFYSLHDTQTPVVVGIGVMSMNVVLSYLFSSLFLRAGWLPHGGLALANSTATGLEALVLWLLMRRRLGGLEGWRLAVGAGQAGMAALLMAAGLWAWMAFANDFPNWLIAAGGIATGAGLYALVVLALGVGEARWMMHYTARFAAQFATQSAARIARRRPAK
jgi:putative peptidoglycan lipid II flippase